MSYTLLIVESPAKCQKIESYLGTGYKCIASFGHFRELPGIKYIDVDNNFKPNFQLMDTKTQQINKMRTMINNASDVLIASDDDREGEAIGFHIIDTFGLPMNTKRIVFHEITKDAILKAVQHPITINMDLVHAQQARQILDVLVGYKISPILWEHVSRNTKTGLSAGRCQTPALRLVYDNQKDIDSSPGKKVYTTTGYFTQMNLAFTLNHSFEIIGFNSTEINTMEQFLEHSLEYSHTFNCSLPKQTIKNPPTPFTTSLLQQRSSSELNISPKEAMSICQKLYEAGYITYMRTDSTIYSNEFIEKSGTYITDRYGSKYVHENIHRLGVKSSDKPKKKSKKAEREPIAQEAHEAIRPTNVTVDKIEDSSYTPREKKMYSMIWSNTVESCMSPALYYSISAKICAPAEKEYKYNSELVDFPGWKIVKGYDKENPEYQFLQAIKNNSIVNYNKILSKVSVKDTKSHYTEAKLVQLLEENGIGRPSTFSSLIEKIQERGYVKKEDVKGKKMKCIDYELIKDELTEIETEREFGNEKGKLVIQPTGIIVLEFLLKHFDKLFSYDYTKNMESDLDIIAKGNKVWYNLCEECLHDIHTCSSQLKSTDKEIIRLDENHVYMIGKYGPVIKQDINGTTTFLPVKKDLNLEKIRQNEYNIDDMVELEPNNRCVGKYKGNDVILKKGKYGNYIEWDGNKKSLTGIEIDLDKVEISDLIPIIEDTKPLNTSIVRFINSDISIRSGKYGNYIYYKTHNMTKPKFIKLLGFKSNYNTCPKEDIEMYVQKNR